MTHYQTDNSFNFEEHTSVKVASFFAKLLCNYGLPRNHSKFV